jgi:hypothetical protein
MRSRLALALLLALMSTQALAAELLMYRRAGCSWCLAWDREIGPAYPQTEIGKRVPLRTVDLDRDRPGVSLKSPVIFTPTFVLVENGREVARLEGYAGEHFFWPLVERLVQGLPRRSSERSAMANNPRAPQP